jgi:dTDP-glucose pyrophosphorylase/ubiquinone/menaquinone biosynthesis C-methylase UbiE
MSLVHLANLCLLPTGSIRQAIAFIDQNAQGIALIVDEERHLQGVVTDGDIRRAILAGLDLDLPVQRLLEHKVQISRSVPLTALVGTPDAELLHVMNQYALRHIPLVDQEGRVADVALLSDLVKGYELPMAAVIMAGGYGTRLRPLTEGLPKPMLPVGDKPLMERVIEQLRSAGIRRVNVTTHYRPEAITGHFGDGRRFGVEIRYVEEEHPLGTAGAIGLLGVTDEPLLVINGDILTRVDFRAMLDFHREHQADMTVAVRQHEFRLPYGVVESDGVEITGIAEKPVVRHFINAGIYLLSPGVYQYIPKGQPFDMPDLITRLVAEDRRVVSFPIHEYWLDIGQHADYQQAQEAAESGEFLVDAGPEQGQPEEAGESVTTQSETCTRKWQTYGTRDDQSFLIYYKRATGELPEMESSKAVASLVKELVLPGDRILDVGCAAGHYLRSLQREIAVKFDYTGLDATRRCIELAQQAWKGRRGVDFQQGDIYSLPFDDATYDIVLCSNLLLHLPSLQVPITELVRVARRRVLIRTLVGQRSFRIQEVLSSADDRTDRSITSAPEVEDEFDAHGEPQNFSYYNIYSQSYIERLMSRLPKVTNCTIFPDQRFDADKLAADLARYTAPDATRIINGWQVGGDVLLPWHFISIGVSIA